MRRLLPIALITSLLLGLGSTAFAAWLVAGTGSATALAASMPKGSTPTANGGPNVSLSWVANQIDGQDIPSYVVTREIAQGYTGAGQVQTVGGTCASVGSPPSCNETVGEGRWQYRVQPRLANWSGEPSDRSNTVSVAPTAPTMVGAAVSGASIAVTVGDRSTSETHFRLERSTDDGATWSQVATQASASTATATTDVTITDPTLTLACGGPTYRYRARAHSDTWALTSAPSSPSNPVASPDCPTTPTTLWFSSGGTAPTHTLSTSAPAPGSSLTRTLTASDLALGNWAQTQNASEFLTWRYDVPAGSTLDLTGRSVQATMAVKGSGGSRQLRAWLYTCPASTAATSTAGCSQLGASPVTSSVNPNNGNFNTAVTWNFGLLGTDTAVTNLAAGTSLRIKIMASANTEVAYNGNPDGGAVGSLTITTP